jgi:alkylation response protein AidB-like acyl-CoA dehydrogenase
MERLDVDAASSDDELVARTRAWVAEHVPAAWREAGERGGPPAVREVRPRTEYEAWYPVFAASGLAVPTWPVPYGGLALRPAQARVVDGVLAPYHLGRLNILGLNNTASALFEHGTEEQRLRFLPPMVRNEEIWCQLFSEPGAGSDLASLATRAVRDGDEWIVSGQKVWTTWAHHAHFGILLARTAFDVPKRRGITYFLVDLRQPGVEIRGLRHMGGVVEFNEVFLDGARIPDSQRIGAEGDGWRVAAATLSGERQMVAGAGSGGVDRIGGQGAEPLLDVVRRRRAAGTPVPTPLRDRLLDCWMQERIRHWTNQRVRAQAKAGRAPGPESSIGKVSQGILNMDLQLVAVELLGAGGLAWPARGGGAGGDGAGRAGKEGAGSGDAGSGGAGSGDAGSGDAGSGDAGSEGAGSGGDGPAEWAASLPPEVRGMLRSRANSIEGGTTEVNKNILGERVLGLPREPDPWDGRPWHEVPRS